MILLFTESYLWYIQVYTCMYILNCYPIWAGVISPKGHILSNKIPHTMHEIIPFWVVGQKSKKFQNNIDCCCCPWLLTSGWRLVPIVEDIMCLSCTEDLSQIWLESLLPEGTLTNIGRCYADIEWMEATSIPTPLWHEWSTTARTRMAS